jgi:hypothetical protein
LQVEEDPLTVKVDHLKVTPFTNSHIFYILYMPLGISDSYMSCIVYFEWHNCIYGKRDQRLLAENPMYFYVFF